MSSDGVDEVRGEVGLVGSAARRAYLTRLRVPVAARPAPLTLNKPLNCGDAGL
jgi:hypothetical protein